MDADFSIVTITLNPAIDETIFLDQLRGGQVNRATRHHRQAGGKGVNVSSMLGQYGIPSIATGFLGGDNPRLFEELFHRLAIRDEFLRIPGETRAGLKIVDEGRRETTDINFPGLAPSAADQRALAGKIRSLVRPGRWFVLAGSLPAGLGPGFLAEILGAIRSGGAFVAADTSGAALATAIDTGVDLVKPNEHELAEYLGRDLSGFPAKLAAARELQREKTPRVILSMGAEGALFLTPEASLMASAPPVAVASTVGAGDALLAGYLAGLSRGLPPEERARLAVAFAWSALEDVTRTLPDAAKIRDRLAAIHIRQVLI